MPALAILVALGLLVRTLLRPAPDADDLLAELERALARTRRPLQAQTTLAALEHRFRDSPAAAGYIRALRLVRYRGADGAADRSRSAARCARSCATGSA